MGTIDLPRNDPFGPALSLPNVGIQGPGPNFGFSSGAYSPDEAEAALAAARKNPFHNYQSNPFDPWGGSFPTIWQKKDYAVGDVNIQKQDTAPENPGVQTVAFSTYGITIPISMGRRRLVGNVIDALDLVPRLIGNRDYYIDYEVPITESNVGDQHFSVSCSEPKDPDGNDCKGVESSGKCGTKYAGCHVDPPDPPPDDGDKTPEECGYGSYTTAPPDHYQTCLSQYKNADGCMICGAWSDLVAGCATISSPSGYMGLDYRFALC
jgi:hypothetical protein